MSLYKMFCADPLHQIDHGVWGKHIWLWYKAYYLSKSELDTLDKRSPFPIRYPRASHRLSITSFKDIPRISKLHHFSNGVCRLKYITAREQSIILRVNCYGSQRLLSAPLNDVTSIYLYSSTAFIKRKIKTRTLFLPSDISHVSSSFPDFMPIRPQPCPF